MKYEAGPGMLAAYLTPDPGDQRTHPAIVWITGGETQTIGDVWSTAELFNDQTAQQYRDAGIVMMYPSQRGGNDNPGHREGFYGEVDDILAARPGFSPSSRTSIRRSCTSEVTAREVPSRSS